MQRNPPLIILPINNISLCLQKRLNRLDNLQLPCLVVTGETTDRPMQRSFALHIADLDVGAVFQEEFHVVQTALGGGPV